MDCVGMADQTQRRGDRPGLCLRRSIQAVMRRNRGARAGDAGANGAEIHSCWFCALGSTVRRAVQVRLRGGLSAAVGVSESGGARRRTGKAVSR